MFKILIAEDDRELRQLFAHVLTKNGYTVLGVSNGEEALAALEQSYYDLIISDIMMPKICSTRIGARPIDGSSSIRSFGFDMSALPMASICCSPPESVPAICLRRSLRRGKRS